MGFDCRVRTRVRFQSLIFLQTHRRLTLDRAIHCGRLGRSIRPGQLIKLWTSLLCLIIPVEGQYSDRDQVMLPSIDSFVMAPRRFGF